MLWKLSVSCIRVKHHHGQVQTRERENYAHPPTSPCWSGTSYISQNNAREQSVSSIAKRPGSRTVIPSRRSGTSEATLQSLSRGRTVAKLRSQVGQRVTEMESAVGSSCTYILRAVAGTVSRSIRNEGRKWGSWGQWIHTPDGQDYAKKWTEAMATLDTYEDHAVQ